MLNTLYFESSNPAQHELFRCRNGGYDRLMSTLCHGVRQWVERPSVSIGHDGIVSALLRRPDRHGPSKGKTPSADPSCRVTRSLARSPFSALMSLPSGIPRSSLSRILATQRQHWALAFHPLTVSLRMFCVHDMVAEGMPSHGESAWAAHAYPRRGGGGRSRLPGHCNVRALFNVLRLQS
jgi:hypothetical protein